MRKSVENLLIYSQWGFFCNPIVTYEELIYVTRFVGCSISKDKPQSLLLTRKCRQASGKGFGMLWHMIN